MPIIHCSDRAYLIRVFEHVVVADEPGDELTVEEVMCGVDCTQAPICVVVGVRTEAEGSYCKQDRNQVIVGRFLLGGQSNIDGLSVL